jgi:hypothetical protein
MAKISLGSDHGGIPHELGLANLLDRDVQVLDCFNPCAWLCLHHQRYFRSRLRCWRWCVHFCTSPTAPPYVTTIERTKGRPLASGRVSVFAAVVYLLLQYVVGVLLYLPYNGVAFWAAIAQLLPLYVY